MGRVVVKRGLGVRILLALAVATAGAQSAKNLFNFKFAF
jgi:hypothetical protein